MLTFNCLLPVAGLRGRWQAADNSHCLNHQRGGHVTQALLLYRRSPLAIMSGLWAPCPYSICLYQFSFA